MRIVTEPSRTHRIVRSVRALVRRRWHNQVSAWDAYDRHLAGARTAAPTPALTGERIGEHDPWRPGHGHHLHADTREQP